MSRIRPVLDEIDSMPSARSVSPPPLSLIPFAFSRYHPKKKAASNFRRNANVLLLIFTLLAVRLKKTEEYINGRIVPALLRLGGRFLSASHKLLSSSTPAMSPTPSRNYFLKSQFKGHTPSRKGKIYPPRVFEDNCIEIDFAGSPWHVFYHIGVAEAFVLQYPPAEYVYSCSGSSCGSLVAYALCDNADLSELKTLAYDMLTRASYSNNFLRHWGLGSMGSLVENFLSQFVGSGAARRLQGRFRVNVSVLSSLWSLNLTNAVRSDFKDDEELTQALLASCYIPLLHEKPVMIESKLAMDTTLSSASRPVRNAEGLIEVNPNSCDAAAISNRRGGLKYPESILFPGSVDDADVMARHGFEDAMSYIKSRKG